MSVQVVMLRIKELGQAINVFAKVNIYFYYFIYDKNIEKNQIFILLYNFNLKKLNFIHKIS